MSGPEDTPQPKTRIHSASLHPDPTQPEPKPEAGQQPQPGSQGGPSGRAQTPPSQVLPKNHLQSETKSGPPPLIDRALSKFMKPVEAIAWAGGGLFILMLIYAVGNVLWNRHDFNEAVKVEVHRQQIIWGWSKAPYDSGARKREALVRALATPTEHDAAVEKLQTLAKALSAPQRKAWQEGLIGEESAALSALGLRAYCEAALGLDAWEPEAGTLARLRRNCHAFVLAQQKLIKYQDLHEKAQALLTKAGIGLEGAQKAYQEQKDNNDELRADMILFRGCIVGKLGVATYEVAPASRWGNCNFNRRVSLTAWSVPPMETPQQPVAFFAKSQGSVAVTLNNGVQTTWRSFLYLGDATFRDEQDQALAKLKTAVATFKESNRSLNSSVRKTEAVILDATTAQAKTQREVQEMIVELVAPVSTPPVVIKLGDPLQDPPQLKSTLRRVRSLLSGLALDAAHQGCPEGSLEPPPPWEGAQEANTVHCEFHNKKNEVSVRREYKFRGGRAGPDPEEGPPTLESLSLSIDERVPTHPHRQLELEILDGKLQRIYKGRPPNTFVFLPIYPPIKIVGRVVGCELESANTTQLQCQLYTDDDQMLTLDLAPLRKAPFKIKHPERRLLDRRVRLTLLNIRVFEDTRGYGGDYDFKEQQRLVSFRRLR